VFEKIVKKIGIGDTELGTVGKKKSRYREKNSLERKAVIRKKIQMRDYPRELLSRL